MMAEHPTVFILNVTDLFRKKIILFGVEKVELSCMHVSKVDLGREGGQEHDLNSALIWC